MCCRNVHTQQSPVTLYPWVFKPSQNNDATQGKSMSKVWELQRQLYTPQVCVFCLCIQSTILFTYKIDNLSWKRCIFFLHNVAFTTGINTSRNISSVYYSESSLHSKCHCETQNSTLCGKRRECERVPIQPNCHVTSNGKSFLPAPYKTLLCTGRGKLVSITKSAWFPSFPIFASNWVP